MTTREELEAMTKSGLIEKAFERFGKRFSRRNNKRTLINSILHLEGHDVEDPGGVEDADEVEQKATSDPAAAGVERTSLPVGQVRVTVTRCPDSTGVHLNVNGRRFDLPPNKATVVPGWILPSLRNVTGVDFTVE